MITTRYTTVETEFLHWLVLLVAAIAVLLALATALAADPMDPAVWPGNVNLPPGPIARPFFPEHPPLPPREAIAASERLWMTFEHQRAGCYPEALAGWDGVRLSHEMLVWKEIGMAAALLKLDDLPQALRRLEVAEAIAPHHPLVAYYRGLVWARQADRLAVATLDTERPGPATPAVERAVLEVMAIADWEEAIERADLIDPNEPLVILPAASGEGAAGPQVQDILVALQAEHFVNDAHGALFQLHFNRREWIDAQRNLAGAVKAGAAETTEMWQLADALLDEGLRPEALHVLHEAVKLDDPEMVGLCGRVQDWLLTRKHAGWLW